MVLYHDKNYFPSASEVYPGVETLVQDEDTQPLETPIIAPIKVANFEVQDPDAVNQTTFEWKFLTGSFRISSPIVIGIRHRRSV